MAERLEQSRDSLSDQNIACFEEAVFRIYGKPKGSPAGTLSTGTGFFYTADGKFVTDNHVIENCEDIAVVLKNGRTYTAQIDDREPATDLAAGHLVNNDYRLPNRFPFLVLENPKRLSGYSGDVFGIGYQGDGRYLSKNHGQFIKIGPLNQLSNSGPLPGENMARPMVLSRVESGLGISGGPLLNEEGLVIGVMNRKFRREPMALATPVGDLLSFLKRLQQRQIQSSLKFYPRTSSR